MRGWGGGANKRRSSSTYGPMSWRGLELDSVFAPPSAIEAGDEHVHVDKWHYPLSTSASIAFTTKSEAACRKRRRGDERRAPRHLWWMQEGQCAPACLTLYPIDSQSVDVGHDMKITLGVK